jgi:ferredoxin
MLVIDPRACVDCGMCVSACPVDAIVPENRVPADQADFIAFNASMAGSLWPNIVKRKARMPDADHWAKIQQKRHVLTSPAGGPGAVVGRSNNTEQ